MTKEEFGKLKETVAYFGHWYDVIGEERVSILEKSIKYIADLERENRLLGERCNQLLKDKGDLTDEVQELKDHLAEEVELHIHAEEYIKELEKDNKLLEQRGSDILKELLDKNKRCIELEQQIEKMKCCENCKHKKSKVDRCELLMYTMNACLCKNKDKWEIKEND